MIHLILDKDINLRKRDTFMRLISKRYAKRSIVTGAVKDTFHNDIVLIGKPDSYGIGVVYLMLMSYLCGVNKHTTIKSIWCLGYSDINIHNVDDAYDAVVRSKHHCEAYMYHGRNILNIDVTKLDSNIIARKIDILNLKEKLLRRIVTA